MAKKTIKDVPQEAEAPKKPVGTVATVYTHDRKHVRTYTLEIHGEGFVGLAEQMAAQHPRSTVEVH